MQKLRSIDDIARIAGVSKSTVSRALNDSPLVSAETKERIASIAKAHSFRRSAAARSLSLKSSGTVGYVSYSFSDSCTEVADPFSLEIMGAVATSLHAAGYDMLTIHLGCAGADWAERYLDSGKVDGFILMPCSNMYNFIDELLAMDAPFVAWGERDPRFSTVCGDNLEGGRLAADRLLSIGKKRLAFLGGPEGEPENSLRREGWLSRLAEAGALDDPRFEIAEAFDPEWGPGPAFAFLDAGFDGIFSCADRSAVEILAAARERGLRVPEDVAIVGYDDIQLASVAFPALTTVRQDIAEEGRLLVRNLVDRIAGGPVANSVVPVELIVRGSA